MSRLHPRGIEPGSSGQILKTVSGVTAWASDTSGLPVIDIVVDHGAAVNGSTDDTAAVQAALNAAATAGGARIISSKSGVCLIAGALQDISGANAQLLLPSIDYVDTEQITIVIAGAVPPPPIVSVIGTTPLPDNHLVFKSTLTSGSGGALLGGQGPAGTLESFTNVMLRLENVTFRLPANPTHTALDLSKVAAVDMDNVMVDAGSYYVQGLAEPTTSTSFGVRLPKLNNGAHTRLGSVDVVGFYKGYEFGEHSVGEQVNAWGCKQAFVFIAAYHASKFQRLMAVHCQRGLVFTGGAHYVDVDQFNIEHAASGWWVTAYDIDDASNYGHGKVKWHVVLAGVGVDTTFTVNGATGISASAVGTETSAASLTVQDENSNVGTSVTQIDFQGAEVTAATGTGEVVVTIPGLTVQDENGNVSTTVTQLDFQGSGVTATTGTGEVIVTIPGATGSELLMQDGVTAPPVPIENEAQDDWLYAD